MIMKYGTTGKEEEREGQKCALGQTSVGVGGVTSAGSLTYTINRPLTQHPLTPPLTHSVRHWLSWSCQSGAAGALHHRTRSNCERRTAITLMRLMIILHSFPASRLKLWLSPAGTLAAFCLNEARARWLALDTAERNILEEAAVVPRW